MLRVKKYMQGVVILLKVVAVLSQAEDNSIEFRFENNEDGGVLDMECDNEDFPTFFSLNQLVPTTLVPSIQLIPSTLAPPTQNTSDAGSHKIYRTENTNNNFTVIPLAATIACVVVIAIVVTGAVVFLRWRRKSVKEKEAEEDNQYADINITSVAPPDPKVVAMEEAKARAKLEASSTTAITYANVDFNGQQGIHNPSLYIAQTGAALRAENSTEEPKSKFDIPYEDVSRIETNDHDTVLSAAPVQGTVPFKSQQLNSTEDDVPKGKPDVTMKPTKYAASTSKGVTSADVRLYEPLDVYVNAQEDPPQSRTALYAQLNRTTQFR